MKLVTIVGARPQFIKVSTVSRAIARHNETRNGPRIEEILVHTGQHFDDRMSDVFFRELGIPAPAFNLGVAGMSHGAMTGRMLEEIEKVVVSEGPDAVLVYGDTNSTLAGALAAAKLNLPVLHVEAGLRSFNRAMPEELNRIVADHLASMLFAPTDTAVANLRREGLPKASIHHVGDVMYDAVVYLAELGETGGGILANHRLTPGGYVLATVHRAENTDNPVRLSAVFHGLAEVAARMPVVLPLHPRTRAALTAANLTVTSASGVTIIDPVSYVEMAALEKHAAVIATDSGGVQREAYFHGVPCVTLRSETEWVELVECGASRLAPPVSAAAVAAAIEGALRSRRPLPADAELFGDGHAAERIVRLLTG